MPVNKSKFIQAVKDKKIVDKSTAATFVMIEELNQRLDEEIPQIKDVISRVKGDKGDKGEKGEKGERGERGINGKDGRDGKDGKEGQKGSNGVNGVDGRDGKDASPLDLLNEIPQLGEPIRDSLELLRDDARLDKDAIKGLDDYDEVSRLARTKGQGGGGGSTARNFYQLMDVPVAYTEYAGSAIVVNSTATGLTYAAPGSGSGGSGTVTSVSVVTANGINGTVATPTTTPAITLDITALNATKIANGIISNTEFNYLDGLTSTIQTQLDSKLSANQAITLSGDVNGFGTTSITTTLSTVNSNVGTFGSNSVVPVFTVNGKGLITAVSSTTIVSGGTPGGANTQVQFNDSSSFGGDSSFTWNKATKTLAIGSDSVLETTYIYSPAGSALDITTVTGATPKDIRITAGSSTGSAAGGFITISGGDGSIASDGGSITLQGGSVPLGGLSDGGGFLLQGGLGRGNSFSGGDVELITGSFTDGATRGDFMFKNAGASSVYGILNFSELTTSNRTYGFQNTSGTLAVLPITLTSQVTGILPVANGGTGTSTVFTSGSVPFASPTGIFTQDNQNFFFSDGNNRLGIGTNAPSAVAHLTGSLEQLRLAYDSGNYAAFTVNSATKFSIGLAGTLSTFAVGNSAGASNSSANGIFLGGNAGANATTSNNSIFIGASAGVNALQAANAIFIGPSAGTTDAVNNVNGSTSIAIGQYSGTGGFGDSIALGHGVINSAERQLNIGNVFYATKLYNADSQSSTPITTAVYTLPGLSSTGLVATNSSGVLSVQSLPLPVASGGTGTTFVSIPPSGVLVGRDDVQTLTNKRITYRVVTITDGTNFVINSDNADMIYMANTQGTGTLLRINADTGTPTNGQELTLKVKSTNAQSIAWYLNSSTYVGGNGPYAIPLLSSTTGSSLIDYMKLKYDTVNSKWHSVGISTGL